MQRGGAGPLRTVVLFCVVAIVLLSFLYVMKRVETNRLNAKLEVTQVRREGGRKEGRREGERGREGGRKERERERGREGGKKEGGRERGREEGKKEGVRKGGGGREGEHERTQTRRRGGQCVYSTCVSMAAK